jgi:hypothetical protein
MLSTWGQRLVSEYQTHLHRDAPNVAASGMWSDLWVVADAMLWDAAREAAGAGVSLVLPAPQDQVHAVASPASAAATPVVGAGAGAGAGAGMSVHVPAATPLSPRFVSPTALSSGTSSGSGECNPALAPLGGAL